MFARRFALVLLTTMAAAFSIACSADFVMESARSSLAAFIVDIVSTAVQETIGP